MNVSNAQACPCCAGGGSIFHALVSHVVFVDSSIAGLMARLNVIKRERDFANKLIIQQQKQIVKLQNEMLRLGMLDAYLHG